MAGLDPQVGELVPAECPDVARVHITTNPASNCGRVELHSVLAPGVVQRSALLQGISESSGESSLPVDQSDIFGWLHVVTRRPDDVASLYSHGVLPDMSKPASVLSAADFVGDSKAYSQAVRELAETLFPSLHACLDGMSVGPDEISGPVTSVRLALVRAFRAEHGMNPSAKVLLSLPPDVARQVLSQVPCSLLELMTALPPPLHVTAFLSRLSSSHELVAHGSANPQGPPCAGSHIIAALIPPLLLRGSQLQALKLNNWALSAPAVTSLACALPHLSNLRRLHLRDSLTNPSHITILAPYLARVSTLEDLDLANASIDTIAAATAAHYIAAMTALTSLDISHNPLLSPNSPLPAALAALTRLASLSLAETGIDAPTLQHTLPALSQLPHLKHLDLSGNSFGNHPVLDFGATLSDLQPLETLCMNNIRQGLAPDCMFLIATIAPTLTRLELSNYMASSAMLGLEPLTAFLLRLTELRVLDLSGNLWNAQTLGLLRGTLVSLPMLRELSVMKRVPDFSSLGTVDQMTALSGLRHLGVSGWLREAAATEDNLAALGAMTDLTSVSIAFGTHSRAARVQLGDAFRSLTQLRSVCILAHDVCAYALPYVAGLTTLTSLEIVDTNAGKRPVVVHSMWQQMAGMHALEVIKLGIDGEGDGDCWDVELLTGFAQWCRHWPVLRELHTLHCRPKLHTLVDGMFLHGVRLCKYVDSSTELVSDA